MVVILSQSAGVPEMNDAAVEPLLLSIFDRLS